MKNIYKISLTLLSLLFVFFIINKVAYRDFRINKKNEKVINIELNDETYNIYLYGNSTVKISNNLENKIKESILYLDSNWFLKGRDSGKMENPQIISQVINEAKSGGIAAGKTFFKNLLFNDMVAFSINVVTTPEDLKLVNRYIKYDDKSRINKIWFTYTGKIKITYLVKVGNNEMTNFYYENSEIHSPAKLI